MLLIYCVCSEIQLPSVDIILGVDGELPDYLEILRDVTQSLFLDDEFRFIDPSWNGRTLGGNGTQVVANNV